MIQNLLKLREEAQKALDEVERLIDEAAEGRTVTVAPLLGSYRAVEELKRRGFVEIRTETRPSWDGEFVELLAPAEMTPEELAEICESLA